jgi:4-hydroxy-4-methyl-2-oxoglutarate aldolase
MIGEINQQSRTWQELVTALASFDSATLFEAAGQKGMVDPAIRPAWTGAQLCGRVLTVWCPPGDNLMLHHAVTVAQPGDVLVASVNNFMFTGAWGEILTVAAQAREIAGLVIDGAVRDSGAIASRGFPVFSRGLAIGSCTKERYGSLNEPMIFGGVATRPGDLIVADVDGIVIIDQQEAEKVLEGAESRRIREQHLMEELRKGRTTIELLGLPPVRRAGRAGEKEHVA